MKSNGEWEDDDEFGTTYGTMKQAMREAAEAERERIIKGVTEYLLSAPIEISNKHLANKLVRVIKGENK